MESPDPRQMRELEKHAKRLTKNMEKANKAMAIKLPNGFRRMVEVVPPGRVGDVKINHFTVSDGEAALTAIKYANQGRPEMAISPGRYCRLIVGKNVMMTDANHEILTNMEIIKKSRGNVLIAGLGLGAILFPILHKKTVKSVTVIEKSSDVIALVERHVRKALGPEKSAKLTVVNADIFEWEPKEGQSWDAIYFDIWPTIGVDNVLDTAKLRRKFRHYKNGFKAWMGGWMEKEVLDDFVGKGRLHLEDVHVLDSFPG